MQSTVFWAVFIEEGEKRRLTFGSAYCSVLKLEVFAALAEPITIIVWYKASGKVG